MEELSLSPIPTISGDPTLYRRCFHCDDTGQFRTTFRMEFCACSKGVALRVDRGLVSY
jgi:hypothetical protein